MAWTIYDRDGKLAVTDGWTRDFFKPQAVRVSHVMATDKKLLLDARARTRRDKAVGKAYQTYNHAIDRALVRFDKKRSAATCAEHCAAAAIALGSEAEMARKDYLSFQAAAWASFRNTMG